MSENKIRLKITFEDNTPEDVDFENVTDEMEETLVSAKPEISEFVTEATLKVGERIELVYRESAELGMGDSTVNVGWKANEPGIISVSRSGDVETVMIFELGKRHISVYAMPEMSFELCTRTLAAENSFNFEKRTGRVYVDYIIEVRGGFAGRRKLTVEPLPDFDK